MAWRNGGRGHGEEAVEMGCGSGGRSRVDSAAAEWGNDERLLVKTICVSFNLNDDKWPHT
jgi:hypothetical protein